MIESKVFTGMFVENSPQAQRAKKFATRI